MPHAYTDAARSDRHADTFAVAFLDLRFRVHRFVDRDVYQVQRAATAMRRVVGQTDAVAVDNLRHRYAAPLPTFRVGRPQIRARNPRVVQRLLRGLVQERPGVTKEERD